MLISDSIPLLWLSYAVLSLVVLGAGYLSIRWLPRLPRLVITGVVAGVAWMPCSFSLPLLDADASYHGMAPAVVVAGIAFLQHDAAALGFAVPILLLGVGLGAALGVFVGLWLRRRDSHDGDDSGGRDRDTTPAPTPRREPVIG